MSDATPAKSGPNVLAVVLVTVLVLVGGIACVAVPMVGILAAIAIPNFVSMQLKAKRSEVPAYVDGLKTAQLAYDAAFDTYVPVGSREQAEQELWSSGGKSQRPWEGDAAWEKLGWRPDGMIRGAYWVEVDADNRDFTVHGLCDVDGDGEFAEYVASGSDNARLVTSPNTY